MTLFDLLQTLNIPVAYGYFKDPTVTPPYLVYVGAGQTIMDADNTHYYKRNQYQIEFYFTEKSEEQEESIEQLLLSNGYLYTKSEDVYIETEEVFVIYYTI